MTIDMIYPLILHIPRLCDRPLDDADVTIIFVSQSLELFGIRRNINVAFFASF
jgi:hypothetical protein